MPKVWIGGKRVYKRKDGTYKGMDLEVNETDDRDYLLQHRPPTRKMAEENDAATFAHSLDELVPSDYYTKTRNYENMDAAALESLSVLKAIRGKPDAMVTIYRGAPKAEINQNDWITLSKTYAKLYAHGGGYSDNVNSKVYSAKVKASDLTWEANSINEFGYVGKSIRSGLKAER